MVRQQYRVCVTEIVPGKRRHYRQQSSIILLSHIHKVVPILSPVIFTPSLYTSGKMKAIHSTSLISPSAVQFCDTWVEAEQGEGEDDDIKNLQIELFQFSKEPLCAILAIFQPQPTYFGKSSEYVLAKTDLVETESETGIFWFHCRNAENLTHPYIVSIILLSDNRLMKCMRFSLKLLDQGQVINIMTRSAKKWNWWCILLLHLLVLLLLAYYRRPNVYIFLKSDVCFYFHI